MSKNILITGASSGIGLSLAQYYVAQGDNVFAACRKPSDELKALNNTTIISSIDITSASAVADLRAKVDGIHIDILINNAGLLANETLGELDFDSIENQFAINTLGALRVSEALLGNMAKNSKIIMITSRMGSIADNGSGGYYGYRMSKAALNAGAKSLALDVEQQGIAVGIIHPGFVQTRMVNHSGDVSSDESATRIADRIADLTLETTGSFWHANGEILPW